MVSTEVIGNFWLSLAMLDSWSGGPAGMEVCGDNNSQVSAGRLELLYRRYTA